MPGVPDFPIPDTPGVPGVPAAPNATTNFTCPPSDATKEVREMLLYAIQVAPMCFEACPGLCGPMEELIKAHLEQRDVTPVVCAAKDDLACVVHPDHSEVCAPGLDMAMTFQKVPRTQEALDALCGGGGANPDIPANETTPAPSGATRAGLGLALVSLWHVALSSASAAA